MLNQTACQIRDVVYLLPAAPCDRCQQPTRRISTADRAAIDLDLDLDPPARFARYKRPHYQGQPLPSATSAPEPLAA